MAAAGRVVAWATWAAAALDARLPQAGAMVRMMQ